MPHNEQLCAALGHYIAQLVLIYCPHHQAWEVIARVGDDADDMAWRNEHLRFGPFDSADDVASRASSELLRMLRADLQAFLARR